MFQSAVPPYVATINDDYHYEVWAVKQQTGESRSSEELLGYVAKHDDSVTVGFNNKLDEQARNQAVHVLQRLADGDKLIAIISHVSELKQEIEDQLIVRKDETGSRVQWQIS